MGQLPLPVFREGRVGDPPGGLFVLAGDPSLTGWAAFRPASDEPKRKIPGKSSGGIGGASFNSPFAYQMCSKSLIIF